jgi:predicted GIY-YIG superfamily endonuclease
VLGDTILAHPRQGSSAVEQGTHKPLVGSSILPPGIPIMPWVYILKGSSGRHYIGSALDLDARFAQHCADTLPLQSDSVTIFRSFAKKQVPTLGEARKIERDLRRKKNPRLAIYFLQR